MTEPGIVTTPSLTGTAPAIRTVLVDMPFMSIYRPNLALSTLCGCLVQKGYSCDIIYSKFLFAEQIGLRAYNLVADGIDYSELTGDRIFASCISNSESAVEESVCQKLFLPTEEPTSISELQNAAHAFVVQVANDILENGYDVVGLNTTFSVLPAIALAKEIASRPDAPRIILGGGNCEGKMGEAIARSFPYVDYICRGEGELLIADLLEVLATNSFESLIEIRGLIWREDGELRINGLRANTIKEMDFLPMPDYSDWLAQLDASALDIGREKLSITFETSRGCWYGEKAHCTFCGLNGPSLRFRKKSPWRIVSEMQWLERFGISNAEATDLILDMKSFEDLLPLLAERDGKMSIYFETKANLKWNHLISLKAARIDKIQPGIESLSTPVLKLMKKGVSATQNIRLLRWCSQLGIIIDWSVLYGFPYEDPHDYLEMAQMIPKLAHLQPPNGGFAPVVLNRFSPLYEQAEQYGIEDVQPIPAYGDIFDSIVENTKDIAYFFSGQFPVSAKLIDAHEAVETEIELWRSCHGEYCLASIDRDNILHVWDSRPGSLDRELLLTDVRRKIFLACNHGAYLEKIATATNQNKIVVAAVLEEFIERGYVVFVDQKYISIAVPMDAYIPASVPPALLGATTVSMYRARAKQLS